MCGPPSAPCIRPRQLSAAISEEPKSPCLSARVRRIAPFSAWPIWRARLRRWSSSFREFAGRMPIELDGGSIFPPIGQLNYLLTLPPYGFYWFLLADEEAGGWPTLHTPAPEPMPEYQTIWSCAIAWPMHCWPDVRSSGARNPAGVPRQASLVCDEGSGAQCGAACIRHRTAECRECTAAGGDRNHHAKRYGTMAAAAGDRLGGAADRSVAGRSLRLLAYGAGAHVGLLTDGFSLPEVRPCGNGRTSQRHYDCDAGRGNPLRTDLAHGRDRLFRLTPKCSGCPPNSPTPR